MVENVSISIQTAPWSLHRDEPEVVVEEDDLHRSHRIGDPFPRE
jgi:hypothetical protein